MKQLQLLLAVFMTLLLTPSLLIASTVNITIKNDSLRTLHVNTYNGADTVCLISYQYKSLNSGDSVSMKCADDSGKDYCKVEVYVPEYEDYACDAENTVLVDCGDVQYAKVPDGDTLTVSEDYYDCTLSE